MTLTDQFKRYESERPEFFEKIRALEAKHNTKIISKMLARRYDFDSFTGIMVEVEFGLFLDQFCEKLEYDCKMDGQTPDWLATINNKNVIVEVARLKDSLEVSTKMKTDEQEGMTRFRLLGSKPQRIYGNVIKLKLDRYKKLIETKGYHFIVGIYNTPLSEVHVSDAAQLFHGRSISYRYSDRIDIDRNETLFFSDTFPEAKSLIDGVLWLEQPAFNPLNGIRESNDFIYWGNENARYSLEEIKALTEIAGTYD